MSGIFNDMLSALGTSLTPNLANPRSPFENMLRMFGEMSGTYQAPTASAPPAPIALGAAPAPSDTPIIPQEVSTNALKPYSTAALGDPADTSIPAAGRAFLNAVAAGESGGKYDVRYTPKGGVRFTDMSRHPRIFEPGPDGPSSASGRYQETATTHDRLGGGSMEPIPQDQRAWRLGQEDYKRRTGRDLLTDLETQGLTPQMMAVLAPTWSSFKGKRGQWAKVYQDSLSRFNAAAASTGAGESTLDGGAGSEGAMLTYGQDPTKLPGFSAGGGGGVSPPAPRNDNKVMDQRVLQQELDRLRADPYQNAIYQQRNRGMIRPVQFDDAEAGGPFMRAWVGPIAQMAGEDPIVDRNTRRSDRIEDDRMTIDGRPNPNYDPMRLAAQEGENRGEVRSPMNMTDDRRHNYYYTRRWGNGYERSDRVMDQSDKFRSWFPALHSLLFGGDNKGDLTNLRHSSIDYQKGKGGGAAADNAKLWATDMDHPEPLDTEGLLRILKERMDKAIRKERK